MLMRGFIVLPIAIAAAALLAQTPTAPPSSPRSQTPQSQPASATAETLQAAIQHPRLDVGSPAPPLDVAGWVNGKALELEGPHAPRIALVCFWASWSTPSRMALPALVDLHARFAQRGVDVAVVTEEPPAAVAEFLKQRDPPLPFAVALDQQGRLRARYCTAAGVGFLPYVFVIGPERRIAWHGHPQQPELVETLQQLLEGRYDAQAARASIRNARSLEHLEALLRDAYDERAWHTALLAIDALLEAGARPQRLLRYKLSILLGELGDRGQAAALAAELRTRYAEDARFLNSVAWDVVSQPRLYFQDPRIGFELARAAYRAGGKENAAIADTYARALHLIGRTDLALEVQENAVALSRPEQRPQHERVLEFYKACRALHAEAAAAP